MWRTPEGDRTLQGAEAELFREALGMLVDAVRDDDDGSLWSFDIPAFDDLRQVQKLAVLYEVSKAILNEHQPAPMPVAYREAAVAAVYEHLHNLVEIEIEDPDTIEPPWWRELILAACREQEMTEELPEPDCEDAEEWVLLIEVLADGVLWDRDFLDSDFHLDAAPKEGRKLKRVLGIDDSYFTAVPPDPEDKEMPRLLAALRTLYQGEW